MADEQSKTSPEELAELLKRYRSITGDIAPSSENSNVDPTGTNSVLLPKQSDADKAEEAKDDDLAAKGYISTPDEPADEDALSKRYQENMDNLTNPIPDHMAPGSGVMLPADELPTGSDESQDASQDDTERAPAFEAPDTEQSQGRAGKEDAFNKAPEPSQSLPAAQAQQSSAPASAPTTNPLDVNKLLQSSIDERDRRFRHAQLLRAGNLIGSGLAGAAGASVKPLPEDYYTPAYENANKPMEDFKSKLAVQGDDPNSEVSKSMQDYAQKLGIKLGKPVSANTLLKVLPIQEKYQAAQEAAQSRRDVAKYRADSVNAQREIASSNRALAQNEKKAKGDTDRIDKAGKLVTAELASSRSAFGKAANTYRSAEAIQQLAQQAATQPGGLDQRQMAEVARNLDSMLSQGQPTVSGMDKLIPSTASGDVSKLQEYLFNLPKGSGQQEFLKRMLDTVQREKNLAHSQLGRTQASVLAPYSDLKEDPRMQNILQANGLPPDLFDQIKSGKTHQDFGSQNKSDSNGSFDINDPKDQEALTTAMRLYPQLSIQEAVSQIKQRKKTKGF